MRGIAQLADGLSDSRTPLPDDHPLMVEEREQIDRLSTSIEQARKGRDAVYQQIFGLFFGVLFPFAADRPDPGKEKQGE